MYEMSIYIYIYTINLRLNRTMINNVYNILGIIFLGLFLFHQSSNRGIECEIHREKKIHVISSLKFHRKSPFERHWNGYTWVECHCLMNETWVSSQINGIRENLMCARLKIRRGWIEILMARVSVSQWICVCVCEQWRGVFMRPIFQPLISIIEWRYIYIYTRYWLALKLLSEIKTRHSERQLI